jgi:hypothetical protein
MKAFYDKYSSPEYANVPAAIYYKSRAVMACQGWAKVTGHQLAVTLMGPDYKSNPAVQDRVRSIVQQEEECRGFPQLDGSEPKKLVDQAAALNDPAAVATTLADLYKSGKRDEAASIAQQLLKSPLATLFRALFTYLAIAKSRG